MKLDLNADAGEGQDNDAELLSVVTSASIACGAHAGNETTMRAAIAQCLKNKVGIGAHPGYADRANYGRVPQTLPLNDVASLVEEQTRLLMRLAGEAGGKVSHVKPHGALSNQGMENPALAQAIAAGVKAASPDLIFLAPSRTAMVQAGRAEGLKVIEEIFADRAYDQRGLLVPRRQPGAVLHDPAAIAERILFWLKTGRMKTLAGGDVALPGQSVCVHGDTPEAVEITGQLKRRLLAAGVALTPLTEL